MCNYDDDIEIESTAKCQEYAGLAQLMTLPEAQRLVPPEVIVYAA